MAEGAAAAAPAAGGDVLARLGALLSRRDPLLYEMASTAPALLANATAAERFARQVQARLALPPSPPSPPLTATASPPPPPPAPPAPPAPVRPPQPFAAQLEQFFGSEEVISHSPPHTSPCRP